LKGKQITEHMFANACPYLIQNIIWLFFFIYTEELIRKKTFSPRYSDTYVQLVRTNIWKQQKENNAERRESFALRQSRFGVNNDTQQRGNILT
jgi:hypothetical protein